MNTSFLQNTAPTRAACDKHSEESCNLSCWQQPGTGRPVWRASCMFCKSHTFYDDSGSKTATPNKI